MFLDQQEKEEKEKARERRMQMEASGMALEAFQSYDIYDPMMQAMQREELGIDESPGEKR